MIASPVGRALIVISAVLLLAPRTFAAPPARPNLVAIVTDDQGRWAVGAYGNREIHTPNMDRIAREGARFTNAFVVTPVCSPSRTTYLTGRYPTEHGITDFLAPQEALEGIGIRHPTWPATLQKHGYRTALVGKWHLGFLPQFHPTQHGFDHFFGFLEGGSTPMNPVLESEGKNRQFTGPLPDILTGDAIQFIKENRNRPFALLLHFRAPHLPYLPVPDEDMAHYKDLDPTVPDFPGANPKWLKEQTRDYYASVSSVDRNVGRVLAALDEMGLADNTLVTFTSDHGYNLGRHRLDTKGNGRWIVGGVIGPSVPNMFDTSITVPLLMRWPAVIEPGRTIDYPVSNLDMYRFALGALEAPIPEDCPAHGLDYSPLLKGKELPPRWPIFGQYDLHNSSLAYMRMVRTARWKYVRYFHANFQDQLFDLASDPAENKNLITRDGPAANAIDPQEFAALKDQMQKWMESINDPLLKDRY